MPLDLDEPIEFGNRSTKGSARRWTPTDQIKFSGVSSYPNTSYAQSLEMATNRSTIVFANQNSAFGKYFVQMLLPKVNKLLHTSITFECMQFARRNLGSKWINEISDKTFLVTYSDTKQWGLKWHRVFVHKTFFTSFFTSLLYIIDTVKQHYVASFQIHVLLMK